MTDLDAALAAADPLRGTDLDPGGHLSAAMARDIAGTAARPAPATGRRHLRGWSGKRRALAALAALGVLLPTAAVAADHFLAQTGQFGTGSGEEVDQSEWIDLCATDLPGYLATLPLPQSPLPPGHTWTGVTADVAHRIVQTQAADCSQGGVRQQATGLRSMVLFEGQTLWACAAIKAGRAGDRAGLVAGGQQIAGLWDQLDGLGVLAGDSWKDLRDRVAAGDQQTIQDYFTANGTRACS